MPLLMLVSLTATMLFTIVIPQRPNGKLKSKAIQSHIQQCLKLWAVGDFDSLMREGCAIQSHFPFITKLIIHSSLTLFQI